MKKIFSFVAAILFVGSVMAGEVVVNINAENAETLGKGSYGSIKDAEGTVEIDGLEFLALTICRNSNNTPTGYAGEQLIQFKKESGYMINKESLKLKSLTIIMSNEANFEILAGTQADDLTPITISATDETIQLKTYVNKTVGAPVDVTYRKAIIDLSSKNFVKIASPSGAAMGHVYSAVLVYETTTTGIDNIEAAPKTYKTIYNGQVVIIRDGVRYNTVGQVIE